jgi:hypothetical protein
MGELVAISPTLSWFAERVERGSKQSFSEIVSITPDIAKRLLEVNDCNRPIKPRLLDRIEHDIRNGQWRLNGEPIIVSEDGRLNDGQHRLQAVIAANKAIESYMTFGVPRDSRFTVDLGDVRTTVDFMKMKTVVNARDCSIVAKHLFAYRNHLTHMQQKAGIGKQDVIDEYNRQSTAIDAAVARFQKESFMRSTKTVPAVATAYVVISNSRATAAVKREAFFTKLSIGANLDPQSPILHLRGKLLEKADYDLRRTEARVELVLRHWNAWIADAPVASIRMQGRFPTAQSR